MKLTTRKTTESDMSKSTYTVQYWRESLESLRKSLNGKSFIGCLILGDDYYDTHEGHKDYKNLIMNRASLLKTQRACQTIELYKQQEKKSKKSVETILRRQKLMPSAQ
jgi:hypothetical protein